MFPPPHAMLLLLAMATSRTTHYSGGLLGVKADVALHTDQQRVSIELRGIPIGGRIAGGASYDSNFNVVLDDDLQRRLNLLRVQIEGVAPSPAQDRVHVDVRLPLFLGRHRITLLQSEL